MSTTFNAAATKTVRVNWTNFVDREVGDKPGIPVVFLHHLTAVGASWWGGPVRDAPGLVARADEVVA